MLQIQTPTQFLGEREARKRVVILGLENVLIILSLVFGSIDTITTLSNPSNIKSSRAYSFEPYFSFPLTEDWHQTSVNND